ncbi:MAG: rhomboid family intramembrane serine protease [Bacteroidetes bacterium]|nr:rhomboid family intramembrane serine protease [Bacteroidota bacterium]MBP6315506.1 rhomboid family intramembrane serine protease [Chitinophagaceae bacterium]
MITYIIIGITILVSLICFSNSETFEKLLLSPYSIHRNQKERFRLLSHGFVHADIGHLAFNMITLYFFGREIEQSIMSPTEYVLFYVSAVIFAGLPSYKKNIDNPEYKAVGASGAVSAVMFILVLYSPWSVIYLKFIIPIYFILFAAGYLLYSSYQSKHGKDNIAHDVHLWGALYGLAFTLIFHPESLRIFLDQIQNAPFL